MAHASWTNESPDDRAERNAVAVFCGCWILALALLAIAVSAGAVVLP